MSDYYDRDSSTAGDLSTTKLHVCLFSIQPELTSSIEKLLNRDVYQVEDISTCEDLAVFFGSNEKQIDCIVLVRDSRAESILEDLRKSPILLPTVIVEVTKSARLTLEENADSSTQSFQAESARTIYHSAEIRLYPIQLAEINAYINLAITKFLNLAPGRECSLEESTLETELTQSSLVLQQRRLTEKIKERLGYLGVYYKRQAGNFYRNLPPQEQKQFKGELSQSYRNILIEYFNENAKINQLIDRFVDLAFFADISTSQILEIHMELIDNFSQQLQIEGRNDDILLDYRLPLIDIIAHLCEMYRRSIPGDDLSLDLLFTVRQ